jgi:hypothetical protein
MSEVQKTKIALASVLKPVNDTRMTEKIGHSLAKTQNFEVHVIGYPAVAPHIAGLHVHSLPPFKRISFTRWITPWKVLLKTLAIRPAILIIATHELLVIAMVAKAVTGCRVVYDVQENYFRNIRNTSAFPRVLRGLVAGYVRLKEKLTAPFVDHFLLAEQSYAEEIAFPSKRFTVIENKVVKPAASPPLVRKEYDLLFSGTLAESTGVFTAIALAKKLHQLNRKVSLTIIGYCSQTGVLETIRRSIADCPYISLIGGDRLVPHDDIIRHIMSSGAGIIAYPPNPATDKAVPTKLYEYLGFELPVLLINNPYWVSICAPFQAALVFDPDHIHPDAILRGLELSNFYSRRAENVFWESEEPKLIDQVRRLL